MVKKNSLMKEVVGVFIILAAVIGMAILFTPKASAKEIDNGFIDNGNYTLVAAKNDVETNEVADMEDIKPAINWDEVITKITADFNTAWILLMSLGIPSLALSMIIKMRASKKQNKSLADVSVATKESLKHLQENVDTMREFEREMIETRKLITMLITLSNYDPLRKERLYEMVNDPKISVDEMLVKVKLEKPVEPAEATEAVRNIFSDYLDE